LGGTYRIVRRIGSGGMGEVYEATHARLAHRYAVKFLHPAVRDHPEALPRFMREAQITSRLRHPGIVSVVDFNTLPSGLAYLVMEYLEGESLGKLLRRKGPLPLPRIIDITDQIGSALTAAHLQGVVHRDMHPQNVFVVPGSGGQSDRIKILDFGISKIASISQKITGMAAVMGTPQYMSPEQAEGKADELDPASDQFSLAAIVYEMLAGRPAFSGETLASIAYQIVHAQPPGVRTHRPELPVEMENVVARGLSKNKKDRFPSVSEFAVHLRWTATLPPSEVSAERLAAQSAPTTVGFDAEETTAVSKLPSDMAAVLRESSGDLTAKLNLPSAGGARPGSASTDDEATTVSPAAGDDESTIVNPATIANPTVVGRSPAAPRPSSGVRPPTVVSPPAVVSGPAPNGPRTSGFGPRAKNGPQASGFRPQAGSGSEPEARGPRPEALPNRQSATHELTLMDVSRRRLTVIGSGVVAGLLAIAIVVGVVARVRRPSPVRPGATAAVAPPTTNSPPPSAAASNPAPSLAADAAAPAGEPTPAATDTPAEPSPVAGATPASEAVERRRSHGRERPRGGPGKAQAVAETGAKLVPQGGQCRITVGTYPWSDLWLDGADTGQQTPVISLPIACGIHRLEFKRRDLKIDQIETVTVTEGREFKRQYELQGSGVDD
jgi:serine/threonine-protein kinase